MRKWQIFLMACLLLAACGKVSVPEQYETMDLLPKIYPDYTDVTVPCNIAPLCFEQLLDVDETVTRFTAGDAEIVYSGVKACPEVDDWRELTSRAVGGDIHVEIYVLKDGRWVRFKPFDIHVSPDSIDPYLSYRLISPSFVAYEELTLNQRCLEDFDERVMVDNMLCSTESGGQCVNCHNFQQYNPRRMQFHARQNHGGTVILYDGKVEKINMQSDSLLSAGVYPSWHPTLPLIAYSTDKTMQSFHTSGLNKVEVFDSESDLILYDVERHEVSTVQRLPGELEVFPFWAPDGRSLYFCSAHFEYPGGETDASEIAMRHNELKYNLYRLSFDPATRQFGERELVYDAQGKGMSATLPRISPDGRWLMFALGEAGCFHIWHHDADLWLMDLRTGEAREMDELNSDKTESYHSWSSNGRWVVFSSRRNDGNFTRPFFAHVDTAGHATKPFELPELNPDKHRQMMKSYNVPELMRGRVEVTPQQMADVLKGEGTPVKFVSR